METEGASKNQKTGETAQMGEAAHPHSRKGKSGGKGKWIVGGTAAALLVSGAAFYAVKAQTYKDAFFPNTTINGIVAGGLTVGEVKDQIARALDGYEIRLTEREGMWHVASKDDIGLHTVFDGTLEMMIQNQNPYLWGAAYFSGKSSQVGTAVAYDEEMFRNYLDHHQIFDPEYVKPYKEAYLSDYIEGTGYEVVPEDPGTAVDKERFADALSEAVLALKPELSLEDAGCYERTAGELPAELVEKRDRMNRYATMTITYKFGSNQEELNGDEIHQWITFDENQEPILDEEQVAKYVETLAKKYNTANSTRKFKTSYGQEVEVSGAYGWQIDQEEEAKELCAAVLSGKDQEREPIFKQEGASFDGNDYGNTYAEVNLTAQHLILYKEGKKILESDFVSGNVARGFTTPAGIYSITYKQRDAVLRGPGYASPVKFWMPFNRGIGFHDASWRGSFGGSIYRTNGSHGCINMPYNEAKTLFENVYTGMPVICYNLDGTGNTKSTTASGSGGSSAAAAPAAVPQPVPVPVILPTENPLEAVEPGAVDPAGQPLPAETAAQENPAAAVPETEYGPGMETAAPADIPVTVITTVPAETPADVLPEIPAETPAAAVPEVPAEAAPAVLPEAPAAAPEIPAAPPAVPEIPAADPNAMAFPG